MIRIAWNSEYAHPLPEGHRFPMLKYDLLPQQLLHEGTIVKAQLFSPEKLEESELLLVHNPDYWELLKNLKLSTSEKRKTGFPHSNELIQRELRIMQGTLDCAHHAFENGIALNIAGGTHHSFSDRGEGFCLLNDFAIATQFLLTRGKAKKIMIVDLDVHQGNGTAKIFENNKNVFTFSMHGGKNYPLHKEKSDLDIPLEDGIEDREYLYKLQFHLPKILDYFEPDFLFYQCGVDILSSDKLGRLGVSIAGCKQRDLIVFSEAKERAIPIACAMGGGYSEEIKYIIEAHANTFRLADELFGD